MVRAFILYYLNIKPTHGYEIQKFLQVSGAEQWAKIQSGSIYYALTKLEKEKLVKVLREERTGSRVRKIYEITEEGRKELHYEMAEELDKPLAQIGSIKFLTDPMLNTLSRDEIECIVKKHIENLGEQQKYWEQWSLVKVEEDTLGLTRISFQMTLDSIKNQILWHEELLRHLDEYMENSRATEAFVKNFDFDRIEEQTDISDEERKLDYVIKIKNEIMADPNNAVPNLDKIIKELEREISNKKKV